MFLNCDSLYCTYYPPSSPLKMIKPVSDEGVMSVTISPKEGSSKHQMTPVRMRRKMSRKDQGPGNSNF